MTLLAMLHVFVRRICSSPAPLFLLACAAALGSCARWVVPIWPDASDDGSDVPDATCRADPAAPRERWDTLEAGIWTGVWLRRPCSTLFDATWQSTTTSATGVLDVSQTGTQIHVHRVDQPCEYVGTLSADGASVRGTYQCPGYPVEEWHGTIRE